MSLPRDPDGYVDVDAFPDDDVDLDLAALAPVPPLPEDAWDEIVGSAPYTDPDILGIDVDVLAGEVPVAPEILWDHEDDVHTATGQGLHPDDGGWEASLDQGRGDPEGSDPDDGAITED